MDLDLGKRGPLTVQSAPGIPEGAFMSGQFSSVHTVVLQAELADSLGLSSALSPRDYDSLLNELQFAALALVSRLRSKGYAIGEAHISGDRLRLCFYDIDEVSRNSALDGDSPVTGDTRRRLIDACRRSNRELTFQALKFAIQLKHVWLTQPANMARVKDHLAPLELRIAMHYGWAQLGRRADGSIRAEGHALNMCRHMLISETPARYAGIFVSRSFHDTIRSTVVRHTQLRQRVFFSAAGPELHELRFCYRIGRDVELTADCVNTFEAAFNFDRSNLWAYYELSETYGQRREWHRLFTLAKQAQLVHGDDEKVLLDIANYYLQQGKLEQSREFAQQALRVNPAFDLAHELLSLIAAQLSDFEANEQHWRNAVRLTPGSPLNNFNLGLAMLCTGRETEGFHYIQEAVRIYPEYAQTEGFIGPLQLARAQGQLPEILESYLDELVAKETSSDSGARG
jgi:tetratricopeptide (TPR) repeat protein